MRRMLAAFLLACCACAQVRLGPPDFGIARDRAGGLRAFRGIAGNLMAGEVLFSGAQAAACGGRGCWVLAGGRFIVLGPQGEELGRWPAPEGTGAVFGFRPGGEPALAWFPGRGALMRWDGSQLSALPGVGVEGARAIAESATGEVLALIGDSVHRLTDAGSALERMLAPSAAGVAVLEPDGTVVQAEGAMLRISRAGLPELTLPLDTPPVGMQWMGKGKVLLSGDCAPPRVLVLGRTGAHLAGLPEVAP